MQVPFSRLGPALASLTLSASPQAENVENDYEDSSTKEFMQIGQDLKDDFAGAKFGDCSIVLNRAHRRDNAGRVVRTLSAGAVALTIVNR
jgi:hypothetical protein